MVADCRIARSDEAADLADEERAEWIAERAVELKREYLTDGKKLEDAIADFVGSDEGSLVKNLTLFVQMFAARDNPEGLAHAAHGLNKSLMAAIDPILREYAEDSATEERNRMEIAADTEKFEHRSAA